MFEEHLVNDVQCAVRICTIDRCWRNLFTCGTNLNRSRKWCSAHRHSCTFFRQFCIAAVFVADFDCHGVVVRAFVRVVFTAWRLMRITASCSLFVVVGLHRCDCGSTDFFSRKKNRSVGPEFESLFYFHVASRGRFKFSVLPARSSFLSVACRTWHTKIVVGRKN